jgi:superfamily II DNA or RNA helicase
MSSATTQQIQLFRSVFKGRSDVFATRWEKGGKSGYMPAYQYDPYLYQRHKMGGGTFQNYPDKSYRPLTDSEIEKHLSGQHLIGVYPLLQDNTSWFLAADFDKDNWAEECKVFLEKCETHGLSAYLERSRSGKGGHAWIFFEEPYPAVKSRAIFRHLLEQTGVFSVFDKSTSFDRLFPNQDALSGKGLGNLIALPLYKPTWEQGNSCFVAPGKLQPYPDQWQFLQNIRRVPVSQLEAILANIQIKDAPSHISQLGKVAITLDCEVRISKVTLTTALVNFLKENFNIPNSEYFVRQNSGRSTWETERYFKLFTEKGRDVALPRGGIGKIIRFCKEQHIDYDFHDLRPQLPTISFAFKALLRPEQMTAVTVADKKDFGVIVAPPGSGKTVIGLKIIASKHQSALILVHRKQLVEQWMERIENLLGIPKQEIGVIGQGKNRIGKQITIATIQSIGKAMEKPELGVLQTSFGTVLVDECHHVPALIFRNVVDKLYCRYLYGLTATPFRKYSDGQLIFMFLGDVIAEIKPLEDAKNQHPVIFIRPTDLEAPFNPKTDTFETLSRILIHDSGRNRLIVDNVKKELKAGRKSVILTERKEHIAVLHQYLKQYGEVVTLSGDDPEYQRATKWKSLREGQFEVLITTGQLFGEGTDLPNIKCLFLAYPFAFEGKLIQYIGRVQRGESHSTIYDYHDRKIDYLHRMFLKRNAHYRKVAWQASLFDDPNEERLPPTGLKISEALKISFEQLEFLYGAVRFSYSSPKTKQPLLFEIENDHIRPEFEVLKPYFAKILGKKQAEIEIYVEIEHDEVVAQTVASVDIDRINKEIIEGVKFRYIERTIVSRKPEIPQDNGMLDSGQLQSDSANQPSLYDSGEALLSDLLHKKTYKHSRHLQHLADLHERNTLKLRFVLSPFSFVFLIAGDTRYHLIWETLDTEEATYLWHCAKDKTDLRSLVSRVENDILSIRKHGRQYYLDTIPSNFTRIMHDYSEERKGFVIWKGMLEEILH